MLDIDNKFEIGQEVYVIRKEKTKEKYFVDMLQEGYSVCYSFLFLHIKETII